MSSDRRQDERRQEITVVDEHGIPIKTQHRNGVFRRMTLAPFELAVAMLAVWNGTSAVLGLSIVSEMARIGLPPWAFAATNLLYVVAGLAMIGGVFHRLRELELFGLVLLLTALALRTLVLIYGSGWNMLTSNAVISSVFFGVAAGFRMNVLLRGKLVLLMENARTSDKADAVVTGIG